MDVESPESMHDLSAQPQHNMLTHATLPSVDAVGRERARRAMLPFVRWTFKGFEESWHHAKVADFLTRFVKGDIKRGMLIMPPRHSKTEFASRRLPALMLGKNPHARIIAASYGADLAKLISRDVQHIIRTPEYQALFPGTCIGGSDDVETGQFWTITGTDGYYRAAGIGGGIGGFGASYGLIDDPIKDAKEAMSQTFRDSVWEWYISTFYPRLELPGHILITMTRWHEDDLAGRLLRASEHDPDADQWDVLTLPAIARGGNAGDPRDPGEALWPARFPVERLKAIKATMLDWWDALYQGSPVPPGGGMFERAWFADRIIPPDAVPTTDIDWCRFWDAAGTKDGGDWTVGARVGLHRATGRTFIRHLVRGQYGPHDVDSTIRVTASADGTGVRVREEQEPGSSGKAVIAARSLKLLGYDYKGIPSTGEKTLRWRPFAAQSQAGNVYLVNGPWIAAFLDELSHAPKGHHDDQIDAVAGAFNELALGYGRMQVVTLRGHG